MNGSILLRCFAKVNLTLDVLRKQDDGYHEIATLMAKVSLHDKLTARRTESEGLTVNVLGEIGCAAHENILFRAAESYFGHTQQTFGVEFDLEKHIPSSAGLGGGSSDAAGAIAALDHLSGTHLPLEELLQIAGRVGADVPQFFIPGITLATGTGTEVAAAGEAEGGQGLLAALTCVIAMSPTKISTTQAYANVAPSQFRFNESYTKLALEALNRLDEEALLASLHNDFEEWALKTYPEIAAVKQILEESGGKALLTGSGAAVFGLYDRPEAAQLAARQVKRAGLWAEMAHFVPTTGFVAEGLMQLG